MRYNLSVHAIRRGDIIIVLFYILAASLSILLLPENGDTLIVKTEDGEYAYSLRDDGIHSFSGPLGETVIEIKDGKARVIDSPCSGKDCIRQGFSSYLCCMPNRIIAACESDGGLDAEAG